METISAAVMLFLVMDPIGNVPTFLSLLSGIPAKRAKAILRRELLIALLVLITFLFLGQYLLKLLQISEPALSISGGVILFLIALRMIFTDARNMFGETPEGEPFIVPLAIPLIAGPSAMATVLLLMSNEPGRWLNWLIAIIAAWMVSGSILYFSTSLNELLGLRAITAIQRLFGMLLTTIAVQMLLDGLRDYSLATK